MTAKTLGTERMKPALARQVARSFGAPPPLVPLLPELLEEQWEIGGSARHVMLALKPLGLPPGTRAIDLGCGKGAAALRLAEHFDFDVLAVDAVEAFIEEARRRAAELGVTDRCRFRCADLHDVVTEPVLFDVAVLTSVDGAFEGDAHAVSVVRERLHPRGYLVIDGQFTEVPRRNTGHLSRDEKIRALTSRGDRLLHEILPTPAEITRIRQLNVRILRRRAETLSRRYPALACAIRRYVEAQEEVVCLHARGVISAIWVLQRGVEDAHPWNTGSAAPDGSIATGVAASTRRRSLRSAGFATTTRGVSEPSS